MESYTIRKSVEPYFKPETETSRKHREYEEMPENKIVVKSSLRNPHPAVLQANDQLRQGYINRYKRCSGRGDYLDISVSKDSIQRSLLIMDALLKGLTKRGYEVILSRFGESKIITSVNIDGEKLWISLQEASKTIPIENSKKGDGWYSSSRNYDYAPTGKLTLQITNFYHGSKSVSDGKKQRVEDKLNSFILMLINAAEYEKNWRIEREKERMKELFDGAVSWNRCTLAREYISSVQKQTVKNTSDDHIDFWVDWAKRQLDRVESKLLHPEH